MQCNTRYFGEIEILDSQIISFKNGLNGFEDKRNFAIIKNFDTEEPVPFFWLQSLDDTDLAFVITVPFVFNPDYAFELPEETQNSLKITPETELGIYSIVTIPDQVKDFTYNLMSPIVVNYTTREAEQVILYNENFGMKEHFSV